MLQNSNVLVYTNLVYRTKLPVSVFECVHLCASVFDLDFRDT